VISMSCSSGDDNHVVQRKRVFKFCCCYCGDAYWRIL